MRNGIRAMAVAAMLVAVSACTSTKSFQASNYKISREQPVSILVMRPDVQVSKLTVGGLEEPNADWTEAARTQLTAALKANQSSIGVTTTFLDTENAPQDLAVRIQNYERLHRAVGSAIAYHKYGPATLPTKKGKFDWSLGPDVSKLTELQPGNYALYFFARDSFSSGGRQAMKIIGALAGIAVTGGQRFAYASLVELKTGNVVWFNTLQSTTGDMRTAEGARSTIDQLLKSVPYSTASK